MRKREGRDCERAAWRKGGGSGKETVMGHELLPRRVGTESQYAHEPLEEAEEHSRRRW